jgi:hypothetical protein
VLIDGQVDLGLNAPEQLGVAGADLLPELVAVEAAIGQDQHLLVDAIEEAPGELALAGVALADLGGHDRPAAAFGQGGYPCLRERAVGHGVAGAAEPFDVVGCVGHVEHDSVEGHHSPRTEPALSGAWLQDRLGDTVEQRAHRFFT